MSRATKKDFTGTKNPDFSKFKDYKSDDCYSKTTKELKEEGEKSKIDLKNAIHISILSIINYFFSKTWFYIFIFVLFLLFLFGIIPGSQGVFDKGTFCYSLYFKSIYSFLTERVWDTLLIGITYFISRIK